jgi:hypothetical protein
MSKKEAKSGMNIFGFGSLVRVFGSRRHGRWRRLRTSFCLESLEERVVLSAFTVTNNSDNGSDMASLRFAVNHLAAGQSNSITFAPVLSGGNTITLDPANGPLTVLSDVTIDGTGASGLTVSGGGTTQVFDVEAPANSTVIIDSMIIQDGVTSIGGTHPGEGGGLFSNDKGTLQLSNLVIKNNVARGPGVGEGQGGVSTSRAVQLSSRVATSQ